MVELQRKRLCVTFGFDVVVDDRKIRQSGNDEEVKQLDLALLHQFLVDDQVRVRMLLADMVSLQLGGMYDDEVRNHLVKGAPDGDTFMEYLFHDAIEQLPEPFLKEWREIRDDPAIDLSQCVEGILACFEVTLVSGSLEQDSNLRPPHDVR